MTSKTRLAAGLAFALASSGAVAGGVGSPTELIGIDFDGAANGTNYLEVGSLDWAVGSSWTDNSVGVGTWDVGDFDGDGTAGTSSDAALFSLANPGTSVDCLTGCTFQLYTHASLEGYADSDPFPDPDPPGLNSDYEWTFIAGVNEDVSDLTSNINDTGENVGGFDVYNVSQTRNFEMSDTGNDTSGGFFFEIYYDETIDSNTITGQGYDDGDLILSASELAFISGDFTSVAFTFVDVDNDGVYTLGGGDYILTADTTADSGGTISPGTDAGWVSLDSFGGTNDWQDGDATGDQPECDTTANAGTDGNCLSVQGTGGTQLEALVDETTLDGNFFDPSNYPLFFISDLVFSTQNVDPFLETDPSNCYDTAGGSGSTDDNCGGYVFGSIVNPDGTISTDVINGSSSQTNCQFAGTLAQITACLAATTAGEDVMFQTDANQAFRTERTAIPEPGTLALLGLGLGFLGMARRRRQVV